MAKFRAKARAVELLGKGQIADLPTAITELWKNGYDAYAKNLDCKLFLDGYQDNTSPLFVLSDDGFGMSEKDILEKWFVLGTDSKARHNIESTHFDLRERIPMGEKGIGRLSVAYLGSQMLMLTKKKNEPAVAFLLDWRVLDNYDFFLEDLNIPLFTFTSIDEFKHKFKTAHKEFKENFSVEQWHEQIEDRNQIISEWQSLSIPQFLNEDILTLFDQDDYHGTSFVVFKPADQIIDIKNKDQIELKDDESLKYIQTSLTGIYNELSFPKKDFDYTYNIYTKSGNYNLLEKGFTHEDILSGDHWIKGEIDEEGFFRGEVRIFNQRESYSFRAVRDPGKTAYGPLSIELGSFEGEPKSSQLNKEEFSIISKKLENAGGLYVYRDNFRVLPYGRPEADFLEFEKRRSLSAGNYFFSHRRMIGHLNISRSSNKNLKDKAGREGFIQNKAYREFKNDLIELFIDLAKRYMRAGKDDKFGTYRESQIKEIQAKYERQIKVEKKKKKKTKSAFLNNLKEFQRTLPELQRDLENLHRSLKTEVKQIELNYNQYNKIKEEINQKKEVLKELRLIKPQSAKTITHKREIEYEDYIEKFYLVQSISDACDEIFKKTREKISIENLKLELQEKKASHVRYVDKQFSIYKSTLRSVNQRLESDFRKEQNAELDGFHEQSLELYATDSDTKDDLKHKINTLEKLTISHSNKLDESYKGFIKHLENLQIDLDEDSLREWHEEKFNSIEKELEKYEELAQMGMSVEIIDHQFNVMYAQMATAIKEIKDYTHATPQMKRSYTQLKNAFQHLETNYKLLRPLYKTSRRTKDVISGMQIEEYIKAFYKNDFERYNIHFEVNDKFREFEFFSFDSIIKPVFLNIINNAIYWLIPSEKRQIQIECHDDQILIMNSGSKIAESQLDDVFTLFYTRRKNGRGIGLHLAKKHLSSIGYEITATNDKELNRLHGACFVIKKTR